MWSVAAKRQTTLQMCPVERFVYKHAVASCICLNWTLSQGIHIWLSAGWLGWKLIMLEVFNLWDFKFEITAIQIDARLKAPAITTKKGHSLGWKQSQFPNIKDIVCQSQGSEMLTEKRKNQATDKTFQYTRDQFLENCWGVSQTKSHSKIQVARWWANRFLSQQFSVTIFFPNFNSVKDKRKSLV